MGPRGGQTTLTEAGAGVKWGAGHGVGVREGPGALLCPSGGRSCGAAAAVAGRRLAKGPSGDTRGPCGRVAGSPPHPNPGRKCNGWKSHRPRLKHRCLLVTSLGQGRQGKMEADSPENPPKTDGSFPILINLTPWQKKMIQSSYRGTAWLVAPHTWHAGGRGQSATLWPPPGAPRV